MNLFLLILSMREAGGMTGLWQERPKHAPDDEGRRD